MEGDEVTNNSFIDTIRKELISIIDDEGLEIDSEKNTIDNQMKEIKEIKCSEHYDSNEIYTTMSKPNTKEISNNNTSRNAISDHSNICNIDDDIKKMQYQLDESCKIFQSIGERFENINFNCLKNRIKDLHLNERTTDSIKTIVSDLKNSFEEKYLENRLNDLTKDVTKKFRNHPGEFGDIPEISEFFQTCTKLEQGLEKLRKQRDDCLYLQKRMARIAEVSYDRINDIQQNVNKDKPIEKI
ncbi:uncharacterized protein ACRADG_000002 [Cochliomyia hominivorax]